MSLAEVTHKCFQSGVSAPKWLDICQLMQEKDQRSSVDFENDLSNSVLTLFHSYPADPLLQSYISRALEAGILSLPILLVTFLQAAKTAGMQDTATLSMVCTIIQGRHYTSGLSPRESLVRPEESPILTLATIQDGFHLLRSALTLPVSPFHSLTSSASELVILLLACLDDMKQVPTTQAMVHFMDTHNLLQNQRLTGDDVKVVRETQMAQNLQIASMRDDTHNTSSELDNISCSLLFNFLLITRAKEMGAGDTVVAVAMLTLIFRRNVWSPTSFYSQLLFSATRCLAQAKANLSERTLWRSFIISRLPHLLALFEQTVSNEASFEVDWRSAMQAAIVALHNNTDLLENCDIPALSKFFPTLVHFYCYKARLIDAAFIANLDSRILNEFPHVLFRQSLTNEAELKSLIESRLFMDLNRDDISKFLDRLVSDYTCHAAFSEVVLRRFLNMTQAFDVDGLSHLCKSLLLHPSTIDIISVHVKIGDILANMLMFFEDCDCESVGDPQTVVSRFGDVVLFLQWVLSHFGLHNSVFNINDRMLHPSLLLLTSTVYQPQELNSDDLLALINWSKALFDIASEGIEDNILRSTKPKTLLRLTATLILQAVTACSEGRMDLDVLNNGVSYFKGPLLNWSLVGVIKALIAQIMKLDFVTPVHLEILQNLLETDSFPPCILRLTAHDILQLVSDSRLISMIQQTRFNPAAARSIVIQAREAYVKGGPSTPRPLKGRSQMDVQPFKTTSQIYWLDQPQQSIREVLMANRLERPASLNISRCVAILGSVKFLQILWQEISTVAQMGDIETCRRLAAFILTCPPSSSDRFPPLLPIFLYKIIPHLLFTINSQLPAEQATNINLLVKIIISSLTGLSHMEWVMRTMEGEVRHPFGESSGTIARRLVADLRNNPTSIAKRLLECLASTTTFITSFPMFVSA